MKRIVQIVNEISGKRNRKSYLTLCLAVQLTLDQLPKEPKMGDLCADVGQAMDRSASAVSRALARVAEDIWQCGYRPTLEQIFGHPLLEPFTPKELVIRLAQYIWCAEVV